MTKKEQNNLLLFGAAAVVIWFLMKKKKPAARMLNVEREAILSAGENMQRAVDNTKFIEASESDAKQYKKDINQCAI